MAKKKMPRKSSYAPGLGTNTTVTIGTAVSVIGGIVWLTFSATNIVRDVDGLKTTVSTIQKSIDRIEELVRSK